MVTEGMVGVRGFGAEADGDKCGNGGHDVDDAFERVGEEGNGAGYRIGGVFDRDDGQSYRDVCCCNFAYSCFVVGGSGHSSGLACRWRGLQKSWF